MSNMKCIFGGEFVLNGKRIAVPIIIVPTSCTSCRFLLEIRARPSVVDHLCSSPAENLNWVMYTRALEADLDKCSLCGMSILI